MDKYHDHDFKHEYVDVPVEQKPPPNLTDSEMSDDDMAEELLKEPTTSCFPNDEIWLGSIQVLSHQVFNNFRPPTPHNT